MIAVRKAKETDINALLDVIKNMNEKDLHLLLFDKEADSIPERFLKNIIDGHFILFVDDGVIIGFLEYTVQSYKRIWVYALYFKPEYRIYTLEHLVPVFRGMKEVYKLPIHFTVLPENRWGKILNKYAGAVFVSAYTDGRIEYCIKEHVVC